MNLNAESLINTANFVKELSSNQISQITLDLAEAIKAATNQLLAAIQVDIANNLNQPETNLTIEDINQLVFELREISNLPSSLDDLNTSFTLIDHETTSQQHIIGFYNMNNLNLLIDAVGISLIKGLSLIIFVNPQIQQLSQVLQTIINQTLAKYNIEQHFINLISLNQIQNYELKIDQLFAKQEDSSALDNLKVSIIYI
ncbi:hypothetical protein [Lentilactobacillus laojiaonis]|uniref:hypothetical protein n=1 Tax=Lentilactobacillus laojiaonis TaxID=2883998 RepID=UPI001D0A469C|nr:hypothetical protein [Lentilactobacillus laojiaonis]UDM32275.1 hypothetical protein LHL71_00620 [Lentilactobacillus laojiaonis]